jgi:hypothetical protein
VKITTSMLISFLWSPSSKRRSLTFLGIITSKQAVTGMPIIGRVRRGLEALQRKTNTLGINR